MPVYHGILLYPADEVVLLHTSDTAKQAHILYRAIKIPCRKLLVSDPFDFQRIYNMTKKLSEPDTSYFVNITGGTKIMSLALKEAFTENENADIFYLDQNQIVLNLRSLKTEQRFAPIDIGLTFALSGNKLISFTRYEEIPASAFDESKKVRELMQFARQEWYELLKAMRDDKKIKGFTTPKGSNYVFDTADQSLAISLKKGLSEMSYSFKTPDPVRFIRDTRWFETEVAEILNSWRYRQELYVSCKVHYLSGEEKNEIDIILSTGARLLFVEVKTQVFDIKDIDKFRNVVKNYGGLAAKALLITDRPVNNRVREKCTDNNIAYFALSEIQNTTRKADDKLFAFIERKLFNNNPV